VNFIFIIFLNYLSPIQLYWLYTLLFLFVLISCGNLKKKYITSQLFFKLFIDEEYCLSHIPSPDFVMYNIHLYLLLKGFFILITNYFTLSLVFFKTFYIPIAAFASLSASSLYLSPL
jgi:hypothetical protein